MFGKWLLKRINTVAFNACDECNECVETLEHILLECAKSILCYNILNACTALNVISQLEIIFKNSDIIDVVYANLKRKI